VKIHSTAIIHPGVKLGDNVDIDAFCIIGEPPVGKEPGELETTIGDNSVIRSHTIIYAGNTIGSSFNTGHHVVIREENSIGDNVSVGSLTCIEHHLKIADGVRIHSQAFIPEYCELDENVWIGPNVVLTNAKYPRGKNVKALLDGVKVRKSAKIGANVTILPGKDIGENALIGSGSVVTKSVESGSVMVGNPAKKISTVNIIEEYSE
jgi:acetyltransferase-like isoleucine patch superfamily enzyme